METLIFPWVLGFVCGTVMCYVFKYWNAYDDGYTDGKNGMPHSRKKHLKTINSK